MISDAVIISLAYPETVVMLPEEWYARYMHYFGIGKRNYIRAGHAALVLIGKQQGDLLYYDFGRYITPSGFGRLRNKETDHELDFPLEAKWENDNISNIKEILTYLATNPSLTHGDGYLVASVCDKVNLHNAKSYLNELQKQGLVRYAAFIKDATNCSRLVSDTLINSCTDNEIVKKLKKVNRFTPSTASTVVIADTENRVYKISDRGEVRDFNGSLKKQNAKYFLDKLKDHQPSLEGTLEPKNISGLNKKAQWLSGIGAGAWFELFPKNQNGLYRFRRISGNGRVDTDSLYKVKDDSFDYQDEFAFMYNSNCRQLHIQQNGTDYVFDFNRKTESI